MTKEERKQMEKYALYAGAAWGIFESSKLFKPGVENVREQFESLFSNCKHYFYGNNFEQHIKDAEQREREKQASNG